ncbi:unnamed protein product [Schistosoma margrebowiei]|uniref:Uncharacterized protein n=1 Tax=Schistosoma margrebowiei TaxID=48269 RepID=A0A183MDZ0_9TREM|nr:unnamed protein product [Schistosoma margrebowiei]
MWDTGRVINVAAEMRRYNLEVLKISETHWTQVGQQRIAVESKWNGIKEAITSTCHDVLGHKKHHHKELTTVDTLDKIQERRNKNAAFNTNRT